LERRFYHLYNLSYNYFRFGWPPCCFRFRSMSDVVKTPFAESSDPENMYLTFCWTERLRKHVLVFATTFPSVIQRELLLLPVWLAAMLFSVSVNIEWSWFMLLSCQWTLESHKDHTVICKTVTISVVALMETEFFITSGLRPPYWKFRCKKARIKSPLCSPIIFRKSYQTASHYARVKEVIATISECCKPKVTVSRRFRSTKGFFSAFLYSLTSCVKHFA
jgi:hypothetical protein